MSESAAVDETLTPAVRDALGLMVLQFMKKGAGGRKEKRKRRRAVEGDENDPNSGQERDLTAYGHMFVRLGGPFESIHTIVHHGLRVAAEECEGGTYTDSTEEDWRLTASWRILTRIMPWLEMQMVDLADQGLLRHSICAEIAEGVDGSRGDDTSSLKPAIVGYLHLDITVPLNPPIPVKGVPKSLRGWNHEVTAALLTPVDREPGPIFNANVKTGRESVTAMQLPRFLYPEGHEYREDDIEEGLFHGHLMIRSAKHLFVGPGSSLKGPGYKKGRAGVAKIIGMNKITPRAIAYVACQVRFALSDVQEWNQTDRDFDYTQFYWNIVSLFDNDECAEVIRFYNHELFGTPLEAAEPLVAQSTNMTDNAIERLKAQRAAKRARTEAGNRTAEMVGAGMAGTGPAA